MPHSVKVRSDGALGMGAWLTLRNTPLPHMGHQNLVWSPLTTSGQETDWVYSYNPGAHTGLTYNRNKPITRQT